MPLPKVPAAPKPEPASSRRRKIEVLPEDFLTKIFEADLSAHLAGLNMTDAELSEDSDLVQLRLDTKYDDSLMLGLDSLLNTWRTQVTDPMIRALRAKWLVVLAQGLEHLLANSGDNNVYLVKENRNDEWQWRSWDEIFVGVGE